MPTLNLDSVRQISGYSVQEILCGLLWQQKFNYFDGEAVATDLAAHSHLWSSFLLTMPIYTPDPTGLGLRYAIEVLLAIANDEKRVEVDRINSSGSYPINTLYLLTERNEKAISQLIDLSKKWRPDTVEVIDGTEGMFAPQLQRRIKKKLAFSLSVEDRTNYKTRCCYLFLVGYNAPNVNPRSVVYENSN